MNPLCRLSRQPSLPRLAICWLAIVVGLAAFETAYGQGTVENTVDVRHLLEEAGKAVEAIDNNDLVEEHYPAQRWKIEVFQDIARMQAKLGDQAGLKRPHNEPLKRTGVTIFPIYSPWHLSPRLKLKPEIIPAHP
jgi:hypothetical protein